MTNLSICHYLSPKRRRPSDKGDESLDEAIASDRSRIVYSGPFKRLQRKAQVYSLESDAGIRSRLTHSLEVADIGRRICQKIVNDERMSGEFCPNSSIAFVTAVENACLLHDIGNPPFGHFGEAAIQKWFELNSSTESAVDKITIKRPYRDDFLEFDGNPQGVRIVTRLQTEKDKFGLNLTFTAILSMVKYLRAPSEAVTGDLTKKPGFFNTEYDIIDQARSVFDGLGGRRHPLTYLMEAADDISYCMSDIEDGINKQLVDAKLFFSAMLEFEAAKTTGFRFLRNEALIIGGKKSPDVAFFDFKVGYAQHMAQAAKTYFVNLWKENRLYDQSELFNKGTKENQLLDALKTFARKYLYSSTEAMNPEIAGYRIISGILDSYKCVLTLSQDDFHGLAFKAADNPKILKEIKQDYAYRLIKRLPKKHLDAYSSQLSEGRVDEVTLRCHLIVDYIAGMTDHYAMETYQLLHGIKIS